MCEYCGCQSLRTIDELTREHDAATSLIRSARQAVADGDAAAGSGAALALLELLGPHVAVEEQALFPAMAREHPEHVAALAHEHQVVDAALADAALGTTQGWEDRLAGALHVLDEHIRKEQDGLFPAALTSLDAADWEQAEQVRRSVGSALGARTPQP